MSSNPNTMPDDSTPIFVSSCLLGIPCRYDGKSQPNPAVQRLAAMGQVVTGCPECLGNLSTPRDPAEIVGDKVITNKGEDVTTQFIAGARAVADLCRYAGVKRAILKSKSPSCGVGQIYDGTFSGQLAQGDGVTAHLLKEQSIEVISSDDIQ